MSVLYSPLRSDDKINGVGTTPATVLLPKPNAEVSVTPLLNTSAPLAVSELDDDLDVDDRETVSKPYPGVDDGFFPRSENGNPDVAKINPEAPKQPTPEVEVFSTHPKDPEPIEPPEIPEITPRNGVGGGNTGSTDDIDGKDNGFDRPLSPPTLKPNFPYAPGYGFPYGHDFEVGSLPGEPSSIPDVNLYQHKKTLAQGMMDLALFSANANQLRYVLESFNRHPYYFPSLVFICFSLILQVAVGIGLIWNFKYNVKDQKEICIANKINNFTVIGIFLVTIINVFISAFGVANSPS